MLKSLQLVSSNLQCQYKDASKLEAIAILENALTLQANKGGAIKIEIKKVIALLQC